MKIGRWEDGKILYFYYLEHTLSIHCSFLQKIFIIFANFLDFLFIYLRVFVNVLGFQNIIKISKNEESELRGALAPCPPCIHPCQILTFQLLFVSNCAVRCQTETCLFCCFFPYYFQMVFPLVVAIVSEKKISLKCFDPINFNYTMRKIVWIQLRDTKNRVLLSTRINHNM